ncbi:ribonuclease H [Agrobacterium bohemicum]
MQITRLMAASDTLQVFTDGSFDVKSGSGRWAFIVLEDDRLVHSACGNGMGHSNNTFEIIAVLEALRWLEGFAEKRVTTLWTDSWHVVEGASHWRNIWRNNGWRRINPNIRARPRKIPDTVLWQEMDGFLNRNPNVIVKWCKGHSGIAGNEHADALARSR